MSTRITLILNLMLACLLTAPAGAQSEFSNCGVLVYDSTVEATLLETGVAHWGKLRFYIENLGGFEAGDSVAVVGTWYRDCVPPEDWPIAYGCIEDNSIVNRDSTTWCGCCVGFTGNVNHDPHDIVDIGDVTDLIDCLFVEACYCMEELDVDGGGWVDIGDLTALIRYLFIDFTLPALCNNYFPSP